MPAFEDEAVPANGAQAKPLREVLPTFVRCGACGAMLTPGDTSCPACGAVVAKAEDVLPESGAGAPQGEGEPPSGAAGRKVWAVAAVVIAALALAAWLLLPTQPQPAETATAEAAKPTLQQTATSSTPLAQSLAPNEQVEKPVEPVSGVLSDALDADQKAHLDELVKREAERAERSRQELKRLAAQEKAVKEARAAKAQERRRAEEEASVRLQPNSLAPVPGPAAPAANPEPPAPAPTPAKVSVDQACAHTTNFLSRDLCRIDACRKPTNAKDPTCVWFRQIEEDRRRQVGN